MTEERSGLPELPLGWVWTTLDEIAQIVLGQSPPSSTYNEDGVGLPFYQGKAEFGDVYPTPRKWCTAPKKTAEEGDVLVSVRAPVGPTNICPEKSCIGRGLAAIRGLDGIQSRFILYLMRSFENVIAGRGTGTTFNAITGSQLRDFEIPLPPLPEQHRVVAKIEELFTQLDAGVAALERAKAQLRRYRQAVLKAAVEGELTREWREARRGELEPASVLLERIFEERQTKWEAEHPGKRYKPPALPDADDLPELPKGWVWTTLDQLSEHVTSGSRGWAKHYADTGDLFVRVGNFNRLDIAIDLQEPVFVDAPGGPEADRTRLQPGDLLMTITADVGMVGVVDERVFQWGDAYINQHVGLVRPVSTDIVVFVAYACVSEQVQEQVRNKQYGATKKGLGLEDLKSLVVPLAPLAEQQRIVAEIEQRLSVAGEMERAVRQSLKRAERLRQSILKRAFEGKLVAQDSSDEPASVLLERIKAEKARREAERKGKSRSRKKKRPQQLELL